MAFSCGNGLKSFDDSSRTLNGWSEQAFTNRLFCLLNHPADKFLTPDVKGEVRQILTRLLKAVAKVTQPFDFRYSPPCIE